MEALAVDDERELWSSLRAGRNDAAAALLFARYAPWARSVARDVYRRLRNPLLEWGDYAQNASVGLLEAMGRFDAGRGIDFIAYAKPRVRGAVFNGVRAFMDRQGDAREDRVRQRVLSIEPSESGGLLEQLIGTVTGLAIGHLLDADAHGSWSDGGEASALVEHHQLQQALGVALESLPDKERLVLTLHYYQHVPFVQIASMLGLTKGRISQLHRAGLERMSARLTARRSGSAQVF